MEQCWYLIAFTERRCQNEGRWANLRLIPPMDKSRWCDDHKHVDDALATPGGPPNG